MIAILNSLSFSLLISESSGHNSGYVLFSLWSGDLMNCLILEVWFFPIVILFGCSYSLLPPDGVESCIFWALHLQLRWHGTAWVERGVLSLACRPGFPDQLSVSGLLGSWFDEVTPHESFHLLEGLSWGCKGPRESWVILWKWPLPLSFSQGASQGSNCSLHGREQSSPLPLFQFLRGGLQPLGPLLWGQRDSPRIFVLLGYFPLEYVCSSLLCVGGARVPGKFILSWCWHHSPFLPIF